MSNLCQSIALSYVVLVLLYLYVNSNAWKYTTVITGVHIIIITLLSIILFTLADFLARLIHLRSI